MEDLGLVAWPPEPIRTERLVLRESEARDRAAFIELLASPEVHTYLGGPRPRDELEREMPGVPERWPGSFVVDLDGAMIGQILQSQRPVEPELSWADAVRVLPSGSNRQNELTTEHAITDRPSSIEPARTASLMKRFESPLNVDLRCQNPNRIYTAQKPSERFGTPNST